MSSGNSSDNNGSDSEGRALAANATQHGQDNVVDWDGPSDPQNPHNWSNGKQWAHVAVVAVQGLVP